MILVIDDDIAIRTSLQLLLSDEGYVVAVASKQGEALRILKTAEVSMIFLDMNFSVETTGQDGLELLADIKSLWPTIPVALITGWASINLAVEGMRGGAFDFIPKPWDNSRILRCVSNALSICNQNSISALSRSDLDQRHRLDNIVGEHPSLVSLLETVVNIAPTSAPVLIYGESGTGKELIARAIHQNSPRIDKPFISVNLGAIPQTLFESEMFGYCKGAFTDAKGDKPGKFEQAEGGTLFLDEIGELDLNSQVKLLRVLQEQRVDRIGDTKSRPVDVRIVCATNRKLEKMIDIGAFREDLYYRINLISLDVPPLRERKSDIAILASYFIERCSAKYGKTMDGIDREAMNLLCEHDFPGNIRELKNSIERAVIYCPNSVIDATLVKTTLRSKSIDLSSTIDLPKVGSMTLEEMEFAMISKALTEFNHNVSKAADSLGMTRQALYRRMEKYGVN